MGNEGISVADALALRNSGGNDGFGGGNGAWWVIILILFFAIGGWGRNGLGNNGGGESGGYNACCTPATAQGMTDAFNFNQLDNGIRGIANGLCDGFYSMNNSINAVASAVQNCCCQTQQNILTLCAQMQQGFCGVDKSIMQQGYQNQAGFNAVTNQLASCCCDIERGQDSLKYEIAQLGNQLIVAGDKNTDRIINWLTQSEIQNLRTQNEEYRSQLQIATQNRTLIDALLPVAKPAYITCSPYAAAYGYPYSNSGCNGFGCGC